jgi:hypothetical protein
MKPGNLKIVFPLTNVRQVTPARSSQPQTPTKFVTFLQLASPDQTSQAATPGIAMHRPQVKNVKETEHKKSNLFE